ncbi:MAG: tyrosine-type recombinase/integrase [Magnetococcales bacterium]|nr:tyrosine-type recombinase/integrase [Magnetococcales bacterium]
MKYLKEVKGRYYFAPSPAMRKAGFSGVSFGVDKQAAEKRVSALAEEWEQIQIQSYDEPFQPKRGDFTWLIAQFRRDPTWYRSKAIRTQEEMDYAFQIIESSLGKFGVRAFVRRHGRAFYNNLRQEGASAHKAKKVMKWFRRLMRFAQEVGVRDDNPLAEMRIENPKGRDQVWSREEVEAVINAALNGGKASSGNEIPPRPSIALAVMIAYDTSLPQQDILSLTWNQFDGEGLTVELIKKRGQHEVWVPLSKPTLDLMEQLKRTSTHIIVSEANNQPYIDQNQKDTRSRSLIFSRMFRRFRKRAGIERQLTFHDLRRTALTELGNAGATNAEIVSFSGHSLNSRVLDVYVKPDQRAARRASQKRRNVAKDSFK